MAPWQRNSPPTEKEVLDLILGMGFIASLILLPAFVLAIILHLGQTRRIKKNRYVEHPMEVFCMAADSKLSIPAKAALLLHDVIEAHKGIYRILVILAILPLGLRVAIYVMILTNWTGDDEQYFAQIAFWSRIFPEVPILKLYDKQSVLSSPWERDREEKYLEQVLGSFTAKFVKTCARRMNSGNRAGFLRLWRRIKTYSKERQLELKKTAA